MMNDKRLTNTHLAAEVQALRQQTVALQEQLSLHRQREAELLKRVEHLQRARELSLDAFTILRSVRAASGQIIDFEWEYANPTAATLLRRPVEALVGQRLLQVLPGNQTQSQLFAEYVGVVESGTPLDRELYYHADGIDGWFWNKTVKVGDGVANFFSDITARKQREEELRQGRETLAQSVQERTRALAQTREALREENASRQRLEEHYRLLTDSLHDGVYIVDLEGRITFCNPALARLTGYAVEDLLGRPSTDFYTADAAPLFHARRQQVRHGGSVPPALACQIRRRDGGVVAVELSVTDFWVEGHVTGRITVVRDLTERKQAEEAARRSEIWMARLIEATQDAVVSIDKAARIVLFNPAAEKIFGYSEAEVQGQKVNLLMAEPYASEHDGYIERYERTQEPRAINRIRTVAARRKSGEVFPIELSVTKVTVDTEVHYAAFLRDISDKVRLQEQLLDNERLAAIGATAAKLAHEIGNPLNSMAVTVQLLQRRLRSSAAVLDSKIHDAVGAFEEQIRRLTTLLGGVRSLSRRQSIELKPLDMRRVIEEILTTEAPWYTERQVVIERLIEPTVPLVLGDAEKLKQVMLNLCKNAVEAMPEGGILTLCSRCEGQQVCLEITDTGGGIPLGVNIFEPFVTTKAEGTGLGLPIVQQIIAAHHGALTYTSESGRGTTFRITLPLATPDDPDKKP
jgi:two-component system sensor kinase FixL